MNRRQPKFGWRWLSRSHAYPSQLECDNFSLKEILRVLTASHHSVHKKTSLFNLTTKNFFLKLQFKEFEWSEEVMMLNIRTFKIYTKNMLLW